MNDNEKSAALIKALEKTCQYGQGEAFGMLAMLAVMLVSDDKFDRDFAKKRIQGLIENG